MRVRQAFMAVLLVGAGAGISGTVTYAAFSDTANEGNYIDAAHVLLTDDDDGVAMLTMTAAAPGDSVTGCILVTYEGSVDAVVQLYGTIDGELSEYVTLTVTRGSGLTDGAGSCTGFIADSEDHVGAGPGVIYEGTLASYPDSLGTAIADPAPGWSTEDSRAYRFTALLGGDESAVQGRSATATFVWHAGVLSP